MGTFIAGSVSCKRLDFDAEAAIDPETVIKRHGVDEEPAQIQKDAAARLEYMAKDKSIADDRRSYAEYLLTQLQKDPNALHTDITEDLSDNKFH